jgi:hypothetical protein
LSLKPEEIELDFEVVKEPWNKYNLMDGSNLKLRFILLKVKRIMPQQGKPNYSIKSRVDVEAYNVPERSPIKNPSSTRGIAKGEKARSGLFNPF